MPGLIGSKTEFLFRAYFSVRSHCIHQTTMSTHSNDFIVFNKIIVLYKEILNSKA